jgi:hypothetical protein
MHICIVVIACLCVQIFSLCSITVLTVQFIVLIYNIISCDCDFDLYACIKITLIPLELELEDLDYRIDV